MTQLLFSVLKEIFIHMWEIKLKVTKEQDKQTEKQKLIDTGNSLVVTRG